MVAIPPKDFIEEKDYENQYCSRCTVLLSQLLKEVIIYLGSQGETCFPPLSG